MIHCVFLLLLAVVNSQSDFVAPWFYHGLDGPIYTQKSVDNEVEVRTVQGALWSSTDILSTNINDAGDEGFSILFDYISGANSESMTIDMTTPVLIKVQPGQGPNCNSTFTVSFYVPYKYQTAEGPPAPTDKRVYIQEIPDLYVGVSEFDGYAVQKLVLEKSVELSKEISASNDISCDVSTDNYYLAQYDPPFRITNRHNEVWLPIVDNK